MSGVKYCVCNTKTGTARCQDGWEPYVERKDIIVWRKEHIKKKVMKWRLQTFLKVSSCRGFITTNCMAPLMMSMSGSSWRSSWTWASTGWAGTRALLSAERWTLTRMMTPWCQRRQVLTMTQVMTTPTQLWSPTRTSLRPWSTIGRSNIQRFSPIGAATVLML